MKKIFVTRKLLKENEEKLKELFVSSLDKKFGKEKIIAKTLMVNTKNFFQFSKTSIDYPKIYL